MTTEETKSLNTSIESLSNDGSNQQKFLTFTLGKEEYGQEILRVREIIGMIDITPLPQTPEYVKGVVNLRGKIIPVIELRSKFGMPAVEYTEETCIIVVEVEDHEGGDSQFNMGVIVDGVSEVLDIPKELIEPAPSFGCTVSIDFILGMGKVKNKDGDKVVILLDIDKVLTQDEIATLATSSSSADCEETSGDETSKPVAETSLAA